MRGFWKQAILWGGVPAGALIAAVMALFLLALASEWMAGLRASPAGARTLQGDISADGRFIVILRDDGAAEVLTRDGAQLGVVRGHDGALVGAHFSADGRSLLTVDVNSRLIVTQLDSLGLREALQAEPVARGAERLLWDAMLKTPADVAQEFAWRSTPWSTAQKILDPQVVAPILPRGVTPPTGTMFRDCEMCPQMVVVPSSEVLKPGLSSASSSATGNLSMAMPLAIGRFEVKREEFARFVEETGYSIDHGCSQSNMRPGESAGWRIPGYEQSDGHPVVCITWNDAAAYLAWLSRISGQKYRLPAATEFDYAAAGLIASSFGDTSSVCANRKNDLRRNGTPTLTNQPGCADSYANTAPVGQFQPNAYGLFDIDGNVEEWLADCVDGRPDLVARTGCVTRAFGGGSWNDGPDDARSSGRTSGQEAHNTVGLRVVREIS